MKKILISLMIILLFILGSCGESDTGDTGDCSGDFPNYHKGLCWSDASNYTMRWDEAVTYCEELGGRLPTISELRTLIKNCPGAETGGECGVTDECLSSDCQNDACVGIDEDKYDESGKYSVFGDKGHFWSSSERSDYAEDAVWIVHFSYGCYVPSSRKTSKSDVRCVK
jgi:uncharacterized protein (TIGR02145 family)